MLKNKKKLITIAVLIIFTGLFYITYSSMRKDVPKLDVTYYGSKVEIGQGSYKWKTNFKNKIYTVDSYAKVISKLLPGTSVSPNSKLDLKFDYEPKSIKIIGGYSEYNAPAIKNNIINIPEKSGTQIYFIDCEWQEGTETFIVVVNIQ
jgi:hypothetical protein